MVHHLSTAARRVDAIAAILDILKPSSKVANLQTFGTGYQYGALIYVWALEQKHSRRGWDEGHEQDVLVPWVLKERKENDKGSKTFERYYHLYRRGELQHDIEAAGGEVVESGYEKDNWWAIAIKRSPA